MHTESEPQSRRVRARRGTARTRRDMQGVGRRPRAHRSLRVKLALAATGVAIAAGVLVPLVVAAGSDVSLSPSALTFADRPIGTTADAQPVQLSNTGDSPLTISTIHITGADAGDFAQGSGCPVSP